MYAVIRTGGKQYMVKPEDVINIELLSGQEAGSKIEFNEILAIGEGENIKIGAPYVAGAKVEGEIIENFRDKKLIAFKYKRRKGYRKTKGHRQSLAKVKISKISA